MLQAVTAGHGDRAKTTKALFNTTDHERHPRHLHDQRRPGDTNLAPITVYKQVGKALKPLEDDHA